MFKKNFSFMSALALFAGVAFAVAQPVQAQQIQEIPQLPMDTAVVKGVLPNGLTYYIRHNETPKGQADFHIAQKVGSIQEEDNQRGLAHFLEHMCFNGTKNFPGNSLISYLESIGVKFGSHLNAYTGTDETVYKITNVPTARTAVTDSVLLILHDWANELLLDPEEIDKERGVIHEEWRTSNIGQMRILEQLLPKIYPGSKYAHRLPIGTMEVVDNFPHQALRDYYEAWYRPDLQGIVVVGDIDPVRTEQVIKEMFGDIEMPANAPARLSFDVPDTPGTIFAVGADKEQPNSIAYLIFKHDRMPVEYRNTPVKLTSDYLNAMIQSMLNSRFEEMMSKPETPFAFAQSTIDSYLVSNTENMFAVITAAKDGDITEPIRSVYREVLRAARGGFSQSEYDRARADFLASVEKAYNNRNTVENNVYTNEIIRSFIDGSPLLDATSEYQILNQVAQMVSVDHINQGFQQMVTADNRVVLAMLPDSAPLPSEEQLAEIMKSVDAEDIEVFQDNVREDPLISSLPAPGAITAVEPITEFDGAECWTLSNGARVIVKKTDFKNDEIIFSAVAPGGISVLSRNANPVDVITFKNLFGFSYGIGTYSSADLSKYNAGKKVSLSPSLDTYYSSLSGSTTPKDLDSELELIYGYFSSVTYPADEFEATRSLYYGLIQNQEANPQFVFQRDLTKSLYASPYLQQLSADDLQGCSRDGVESLARAAVADASAWTFIFTGNVDVDRLKALCEKYLAVLPSSSSTPARIVAADPEFEMIAGSGTDNYQTPMETPQTYCAVIASASVPFTSSNAKLAGIAGQILSARLIKTVREEMQAVYSISAFGDLEEQDGLNATIGTVFPMNPEKKDEVLKVIADELKAMSAEVTTEELNKVKEYMVKSYAERMEENPSWSSYLTTWVRTGKNLLGNAVEEVNAVTPEIVQDYIQTLLAADNYRVVLLEAKQ